VARLKTIDTWRLHVPTGTTHPNRSNFKSAEVEDTVAVLVPVKMDSRDGKTYFVVDHKYGAHTFKDQGTDINALRERTRAWLATVVSFVWEDFLFVQFKGAKPTASPRRWRGDEAAAQRWVDVDFTFRHYQVATNHAGTKVYRDMTGMMQGGAVIQGMPDTTGPNRGVLVPKTPENEAALHAIADGFIALSTKLDDLLHPDRIQNTLRGVNLQQLNLTHIPVNEPAPAAAPKRTKKIKPRKPGPADG
jgi:hypothetical protein